MAGVRVGVVGCGYWGSKHVRVLEAMAGVDQVVAIDHRAERLGSLQRAFPRLGVFSDLESALEHVDAVVVATPAATHVPLALTAIAAGKGVFVEKPFATSTSGARQVLDAAAERSVTVMAGHTFLYNAAVWYLRDLIQSGDLGKIYYLDAARLNLGLYQPDINVAWDLAPHDISIANYLLGSQPDSVDCWGSSHAHHLEDVVYMRLLYSELGVTANIHLSWLDPSKVRRVTVVGSDKMAVYNDMALDERLRIFDKGVTANSEKVQDMPMSYRTGDIRSPYIDFREPLMLADQDFVTCVATASQPTSDGGCGLAVVQVLEAAEISLREGRRVALSELSENDHRVRATVDLS